MCTCAVWRMHTCTCCTAINFRCAARVAALRLGQRCICICILHTAYCILRARGCRGRGPSLGGRRAPRRHSIQHRVSLVVGALARLRTSNTMNMNLNELKLKLGPWAVGSCIM